MQKRYFLAFLVFCALPAAARYEHAPLHSWEADHAFIEPRDTGYASLTDPLAIPFVDAVAREQYKSRFLILRAPKAFAIGARGQWQFQAGDAHAMRLALERCNAYGKGPCWLYAVDEKVVWSEARGERISIDMLVPARHSRGS